MQNKVWQSCLSASRGHSNISHISVLGLFFIKGFGEKSNETKNSAFCNLILTMLFTSLCGLHIQAYLRDIAGMVPDQGNKATYNLFALGESCLQFVKKNTTSVKCNNAKCNKTKYTYIGLLFKFFFSCHGFIHKVA